MQRDRCATLTIEAAPMISPFNSVYSHGFIRASVCIPRLRVADPVFNAERTLAMAERASAEGAALAVFPELGLSAYSNEDLFQQDALQEATLAALETVVQSSANWTPIVLVGSPLRVEDKLFNCAVVVYRGSVLGVVPKSYLPNYREFYEKRQFAAARDAIGSEMTLFGMRTPFGNDLIFDAENLPAFRLHVEVCEDVWTPIPPSTYAALAGATVLANLSASNITVAKADYRRQLCSSQSAKCMAAYLYSGAGPGESTTDLAWDGHGLIYADGALLAESERFAGEEQFVAADIDLERLVQDRSRMTACTDSATDHKDQLRTLRHVAFDFERPGGEMPPLRKFYRFPYVPSDPASLDERCYEVYNIQVHGLMKRLEATGIKRGDRRVGRAGFDAGAAGGSADDGPARAAAHEHPGVYHARLRHQPVHQKQCAPADDGSGGAGPRDRHPPVGAADVGGHWASVRRWRGGIRRDVRERAGKRAHVTPVPVSELPRRHGFGYGRFERTGVGLGDLRRGRSYVALQRQWICAQDAHPVLDPVGGGQRSVRTGDICRSGSHRGDGDLARVGAGRSGQQRSAKPEHRGDDRTV